MKADTGEPHSVSISLFKGNLERRVLVFLRDKGSIENRVASRGGEVGLFMRKTDQGHAGRVDPSGNGP